MFSKIKKFYANLSIQKKSVLWYTIATILQNAILFLTTPIYTRLLTESEYGIFSVYQSWQQIFSIISIIALDRCITVGFMKYENNRPAFLSSIQLLMTLTVGINIILVLVLKSTFVNFIGLPIFIIVMMCIVSLANNTLSNWSWLQRYNYNYKKLAIVTITSTFLIQMSGIISIILTKENQGYNMIMAMALTRVLIYGIIYIFVFANGKKGYSKEYWKFSVKYSLAVVPHALSQIILNSSDRIMIDKICGKAKAAYYSVTYSSAMVLNIVLQSISSAMQPWFFNQIKEKNYAEIKEKTNIILLFSAILSVFVCLIAPEILLIMAPSSYKEAVLVFPPVVGGVFFNSMYLYFANFESYYEKPHYFSIATTIGAVINIILNFLLIPKYGFVAAGYTTLICYIIYAFMHYFFMRKICNEKLNKIKVFDTKFIIVLSCIVLLALLLTSFLYNYLIIRYIFISIICLISLLKYKQIKRIIFNIIKFKK